MAKKKMAKGGVTGAAMKAVGRNMAKANLQSGTMKGAGAATKGKKISAKMG